MKVASCGFGSEGVLSSVLRVWACSSVLRYPFLEVNRSFNAPGCHDRVSDRMEWCSSAQSTNIRILRIIRALFPPRKTEKLCHNDMSDKAAALQPHKQIFRRG